MMSQRLFLNCAVAALLAFSPLSLSAQSDEGRVTELLELLQMEDLPNWEIIEQEIQIEWARSGSPAMDLLYRRGQEAMEGGDVQLAIEHFTALTDHAPEFAEGFNARALAYFTAGLYGPALQDIQQTLILNPNHFGALSGLGAIYEQSGKEKQAYDAYVAARAIHPHEPDLKQAVERLEARVAGTRL